MIAATTLNYEYIKQINRIHSDFNSSIKTVDRDSYLNHAIDIIQENLNVIVEVNPTLRNHLRQLEKKNVSLSLTTEPDYVIATIPTDYYRGLRIRAIASKPGCSTKELRVHTIQTDDLSEAMVNPNWKPSFNWEETFADEASRGIYVYKTDFNIDQVFIDYIQKIPHIATPSLLDCDPKCYVDSSGQTICKDQDFLIDSTFLWRKVVDLAVLLTLRDLGQVDDYSSKVQSILFTDKVYLN